MAKKRSIPNKSLYARLRRKGVSKGRAAEIASRSRRRRRT